MPLLPAQQKPSQKLVGKLNAQLNLVTQCQHRRNTLEPKKIPRTVQKKKKKPTNILFGLKKKYLTVYF